MKFQELKNILFFPRAFRRHIGFGLFFFGCHTLDTVDIGYFENARKALEKVSLENIQFLFYLFISSASSSIQTIDNGNEKNEGGDKTASMRCEKWETTNWEQTLNEEDILVWGGGP